LSIPFFLSDNGSGTKGFLGLLDRHQGQAVGIVAQVAGIVVDVFDIVEVADFADLAVQVENIAGMYNSTTDHTVEYNSMDFHKLGNYSYFFTFLSLIR
jgi:hypothetical protein